MSCCGPGAAEEGSWQLWQRGGGGELLWGGGGAASPVSTPRASASGVLCCLLLLRCTSLHTIADPSHGLPPPSGPARHPVVPGNFQVKKDAVGASAERVVGAHVLVHAPCGAAGWVGWGWLGVTLDRGDGCSGWDCWPGEGGSWGEGPRRGGSTSRSAPTTPLGPDLHTLSLSLSPPERPGAGGEAAGEGGAPALWPLLLPVSGGGGGGGASTSNTLPPLLPASSGGHLHQRQQRQQLTAHAGEPASSRTSGSSSTDLMALPLSSWLCLAPPPGTPMRRGLPPHPYVLCGSPLTSALPQCSRDLHARAHTHGTCSSRLPPIAHPPPPSLLATPYHPPPPLPAASPTACALPPSPPHHPTPAASPTIHPPHPLPPTTPPPPCSLPHHPPPTPPTPLPAASPTASWVPTSMTE